MRRRLPWERIRDFAIQHGVSVHVVSNERLREVPSPFSGKVGLRWQEKKLFVGRKYLRDKEGVGHMIHELGHLIASRETPERSSEGDFLGWEWQVAKKLKVRPHWEVGMTGYGMNCGDYSDTPLVDRQRELREALEEGKKYGNISPSGEPLAVR